MKPTLRDKLFKFFFMVPQHFFPLILMIVWGTFLYRFYQSGHWYDLVLFVLTPYLMPLICFRLLVAVYPLKEGRSFIGNKEPIFSAWLFSLRIQQIYVVIPQLERLLFFLPGMYAGWLKLWGSKIGKGVFFVPGIEVLDRSMLDIGNNVVFGHEVQISPHVLYTKNNRFLLYLKTVTIGDNVFVGAFTRMGPGTNIKNDSFIPVGSYFTINQREAKSIMGESS